MNRYPDTPSTARRRPRKAQKAKRPAHLPPPALDAGLDPSTLAPPAPAPLAPPADVAHGRPPGAGNTLAFFAARKAKSSGDDDDGDDDE